MELFDAYFGLAQTLQELGLFEESMHYVEKALDAANTLNHTSQSDKFTVLKSELLIHTHHYNKAQKLIQNLSLNQNHSNYQDLLIRTNSNQLLLYAQKQNTQAIQNLCEDALHNSNSTKNTHTQASFYLRCGQLLAINDKNRKLSTEYFAKSWKIYKQVSSSRFKASGLLQLSRSIYSRDLNNKILNSAVKVATQIATDIKDDWLLSESEGLRGLIAFKKRQYANSLGHFRKAALKAQKSNMKHNLYRWQWYAGRCLKLNGQYGLAVKSYRNALKSLEEVQAAMLMSDAKLSESSVYETSIEPVYYELAELLIDLAAKSTNEIESKKFLTEARNTIESMRITELQDYLQDECSVGLRAHKNKTTLLRNGVAVLHIVPFKDSTALLVSVADKIELINIAVGIKQLRSEVKYFRKNLQDVTTRRYLIHGRQLYDWLIAPAKNILDNYEIKTLVMVPDRAIRKIPLGALVGDNKYLLNDYALVVTQGMNLLSESKKKQFVNKIFTAGLTESRHGYSALKSVNDELSNICKDYQCRPFLDKKFQKRSFRKTLEDDSFEMIHLASHGELSKKVEDSFVLTWDGRLSMDGLESCVGASSTGDRSLELLSLSACQTASGDDRAALGLAGMSIKAGARSALASLWFVSDKAASRLFVEFYKLLKLYKGNKAKALQEAQLKLLQSPEFSHPMFWSPFVLVGNWN